MLNSQKGLLLHRWARAFVWSSYQVEGPCFVSALQRCKDTGWEFRWKFSFFSTDSQRCFPKSFAPELAQMCLAWARTLKQSRGEVHKTTYDLLQTEIALSF